MTSISPSSLSVSDGLRIGVQRLQAEIARKQTEATTGKVADAGLALGGRRGQVNALTQQNDALQTIIDTNAVVTARLDTSQAALSNISGDAQSFLKTLIANASGATDPKIIQGQANGALTALSSTLNTSVNGEYIFGGINSGQKPVADYPGVPAGAAKLAFDAAFQSTFGFSSSDPAAASITSSALGAFIDTQFSALYDASAYKTNVSTASDTPLQSLISQNQSVDSSASANAKPFRQLYAAYTLISEFAGGNVSTEAFKTVVDKASSIAGEAGSGLTKIATSLGTTQSATTTSSDRLKLQQDILTKSLGNLQDVDPYATNARISTLTTQIETAYSLTSRLQQLSLLKYL